MTRTRRRSSSRCASCSTSRPRERCGSSPTTGSACRLRAEPGEAVKELVSFLPVLAYDGANMTQIDAGGILDIAMAGTSATLLARKWESALLVNVDNDTLRRILDNPEAMAAVERIEGWRTLGRQHHRDHHQQEREGQGSQGQGEGQGTDGKAEEAAYRGGEGIQVQAKARTGEVDQVRDANSGVHVLDRLPREHASGRHHEAGAGLFLAVTGLTVKDFHLLVSLRVFNTEHMNQAVFAFRRYEDASLRYAGIESHQGLTHYGLYDTVVARD